MHADRRFEFARARSDQAVQQIIVLQPQPIFCVTHLAQLVVKSTSYHEVLHAGCHTAHGFDARSFPHDYPNCIYASRLYPVQQTSPAAGDRCEERKGRIRCDRTCTAPSCLYPGERSVYIIQPQQSCCRQSEILVNLPPLRVPSPSLLWNMLISHLCCLCHHLQPRNPTALQGRSAGPHPHYISRMPYIDTFP